MLEISVTRIEPGHIQAWWLEERAEVDIIVPPEARVYVAITVFHLHGALDGDSYPGLVEAVRAEREAGVGHVVVDMDGVESLGTAGLVGLYAAGCALEGETLEGLEGHGLMADMRRAIDKGERFDGLCIAGANERVDRALQATHFSLLARVLPGVDDAIATLARESYGSSGGE